MNVHDTYFASDADATVALYKRLEAVGPRGIVAMNLLRACKASERAKKYRGGNSSGSYRRQAYAKKEWSIAQLIGALRANADAVGISWGWGYDAGAINFEHVVFIELPEFGQVSFHMQQRLGGEDHSKPWDGIKGLGASRIIRFACAVLGDRQPDETQGERDVRIKGGSEGSGPPRAARGTIREADGRTSEIDPKLPF